MASEEGCRLNPTSRYAPRQVATHWWSLTAARYWRTSLLTISHVMLRNIQFGCNGGNAYAGASGRQHWLHNSAYAYVSQTTGTLLWQIANQSLNVAINSANANKSTPLSTATMVQSYVLAVSASCSVALGLNGIVPRLRSVSPATKTILTRLVPFAAVASAGALNVFLMRGEEIRKGIDVYPVLSEEEKLQQEQSGKEVQSLGKSKKAATIAVAETAVSRVLNATPIMVLPPLILVRLQRTQWLKRRPKMTLPINLGTNLVSKVERRL